MSEQVIPSRESLALAWMQNFRTGIASDPASFDLVAADAVAIGVVVDAFAAAYTVVMDPGTRTKVTIITKDETRASAEQLCRQYAIQIKYNAGISNALKASIGVNPVNTTRTPINVPDTSPLLNIVAVTPGMQVVRFADATTPDSGAKPFGAAQLEVYRAVGDAVVTDPDNAEFFGLFTRNPVKITFTGADDGKLCTYFARWCSKNGEVGPWSLGVSMRVAA